MPIAVIAVSMLVMLVVATPSEASQSCMSKTEARQHFGAVHIYWHGPDHCWVATPTQRRPGHGAQRTHHHIHQVQQTLDQPTWHDSMASDDETVQSLRVRTSLDVEHAETDVAAAGSPQVDSCVDIETD